MEAARALRAHAGFDIERIDAIERETRHDVIAFTTAVAEKMAAAGRRRCLPLAPLRLTSNDVVDTAQALMLKQASKILIDGARELAGILKRRAYEFKNTVQIGRTHGIHAEPITFGLKLALWYDEVVRGTVRLEAAAEDLRVGKISGAVGTFGHIGPEAEEKICARLGLKPAAISSQVIARDRHAAWVSFAGAHHRHAGEDCPRNPPPAAHRSAGSRGALWSRPERVVRHAPQAQSGGRGADLRAGSGGPVERPGGASKMSRCGMSGISPTPRWSVSFLLIRRSSPITCWPRPGGWWMACGSTRNACLAIWNPPRG